MENDILAHHLFVHIEERDVRAHRISLLVGRPVLGWLACDVGAILDEGVVHVDVYGCAISLCLPVAGHGYLRP